MMMKLQNTEPWPSTVIEPKPKSLLQRAIIAAMMAGAVLNVSDTYRHADIWLISILG